MDNAALNTGVLRYIQSRSSMVVAGGGGGRGGNRKLLTNGHKVSVKRLERVLEICYITLYLTVNDIVLYT